MNRCYVVQTNPNDVTGGGGCLCGNRRLTDAGPPNAVFPATDMEDPQSPSVVLCLGCPYLAKARAGEVGVGGEDSPVEAIAEEIPDEEETSPHEDPPALEL